MHTTYLATRVRTLRLTRTFAICSCGWIGQDRITGRAAEADSKLHMELVTPVRAAEIDSGAAKLAQLMGADEHSRNAT